jgi:hypothetical protein
MIQAILNNKAELITENIRLKNKVKELEQKNEEMQIRNKLQEQVMHYFGVFQKRKTIEI